MTWQILQEKVFCDGTNVFLIKDVKMDSLFYPCMKECSKYVIPRKDEVLTWESPGTIHRFAQ